LGRRRIYKAKKEKLECINTHQAAKTHKRVISPPRELAQASPFSLPLKPTKIRLNRGLEAQP